MIDYKVVSFLAVAETQNYTKAAEQLHLSQPAISQHIQKLEQHYGCKFFAIIGNKPHLTREGEIFYRFAALTCENERSMLRLLKNEEDIVRIGSVGLLTNSIIADLIPLPVLAEINGSIVSLPVKELYRQLKLNELDCALLIDAQKDAILECRPVVPLRILPMVSPIHPLANKTSIAPEELLKYPFITCDSMSINSSRIIPWLNDHGCPQEAFARVFNAGSFKTAKQYVKESDGITVFWELEAMVELQTRSLVALDVNDFRLGASLDFVFQRHSLKSKALERLYSSVISAVRHNRHSFTV